MKPETRNLETSEYWTDEWRGDELFKTEPLKASGVIFLGRNKTFIVPHVRSERYGSTKQSIGL